MRDYAKRQATPARKQRQPDGNWLLILFVFFAVSFLSFTTYHFVHERLFSENMTKPVLMAPIEKPVTQKAIAIAPANPIKKHIEIPIDMPSEKTAEKTSEKTDDKPPVTHKIISLFSHTKPATLAVAKKPKKVVETPPTDNQPKYDFYQLLPKMTVVIPSDTDNTGIPSSTIATHVASTVYALQIASLSSPSDAKEVELTLKSGAFPTYVQRYEASDHSVWYRVMVGPITNLKTAQAIQTKLYAHQMVAMLMKVPK